LSEPNWINIPVSGVDLRSFDGALRIDGFYSDNDYFRHVLVATHTQVFEFFYSTLGQGTALLTGLDVPPTDIAGLYSANNKSRHAFIQVGLTAELTDGFFYEITYDPVVPSMEAFQPFFDGVPQRISALYNSVTHIWHVVQLYGASSVCEVIWNKKLNTPGHVNWRIPIFLPGSERVLDVAAFFTPDDNNKHAIILRGDGSLIEAYWSTNIDETLSSPDDKIVSFSDYEVSSTLIGTVPGGATAVAAFYVEGLEYSRRIVAAGPQGVFEFAYDPAIPVVRAAQLATFTDVIDIAGFFSTDDKACHALVLRGGNGTTPIIRELYYYQ
jgi:hypothetical protein